MELIDTSIVNVALADISGNLGATIEDAAWVITAYAIANVIIIPLTGFFAKLFGRKRYYLGSIILFTIASWLCGQAGSLEMLVVLAVCTGHRPEARCCQRHKEFYLMHFRLRSALLLAVCSGWGLCLDQRSARILGGVIVENYHWSLIFNINIPFGIAASLLTLRFINETG